MVIEYFKLGCLEAIYERFDQQGRYCRRACIILIPG